MLMSEQDGPVKGKRQAAIDGHLERRAAQLGRDTVVICDTHWVINAGFHINANHRFHGLFTSNEFPQFIQDMPLDHQGNPAWATPSPRPRPRRGSIRWRITWTRWNANTARWCRCIS
jgi:3,4-dihydroxyphenylacetate 2,3-dioxygenase